MEIDNGSPRRRHTIVALPSRDAAYCAGRAGITTYSPLAHFGAKAKGAACTTGVVGFGGLGHMAVKLAKAMVEPPATYQPQPLCIQWTIVQRATLEVECVRLRGDGC